MKISSVPAVFPKTAGRLFPLKRQKRQAFFIFILVCCDILAIGAAFIIAYQSRFVLLPYTAAFQEANYRSYIFLIIPIWILIFIFSQLYNPRILFGGLQEYSRVFNAISIGMGTIIIIDFLRREEVQISRGWLVLSWFMALVLVTSLRFLFRRFVYTMRKRRHFLSPTIIVGANNEGKTIAGQLQNWPTSGLFIIGFVDHTVPVGTSVANGYTVIDKLENLEKSAKQNQVEEIIIAPTAFDREQLLNIFRIFNPNPDVNVRLSTGLFEILSSGLSVKELSNVPLIEFNKGRITGVDMLMKSFVDYILAIICLVLLSPIFLIIGVLIKADSPGKIFYRRQVMGTNGKTFDAFKFRTMFTNGDDILEAHPELRDELEHEFKLKDDPRVTRIGKYLRKFSIDELPQIVNVLLGQMSMVGPRMISPPEMELYGAWGMNLLTVKPGITGLWQVSGRSDVSYEERIRLDMYYIRNWTIWMDIYILLMTIPAVFRKKGAY